MAYCEIEKGRGFPSHARGPVFGIYTRFGKRMFDLAFVVALFPVWGSLITFLWILARLETGFGGFSDERVGQFGRSFRCLKIRTMRADAVRVCAAYKDVCDPRITPLGRILRRSSLDELPQLWCVLKGEMSLVGPRPVPALELNRYGAQRHAYLQMRPGLTGLWQVSGRNALSYEHRVALDTQYARSVSFWSDLKILFATVREVVRLSGR
ncbi:lipopolysaccharide/colanic/teichoic acid biosynthesis glycosyltransferase [Planktotalea frisia]|uniref:Undecaprenyl phosphate N,N'-diacetylbacillosamine 1-phosphate transferase n=1 Tax=Planktotalea frisia TaxID=696762 RepID=A0A1L9NSF1_9RHOB|nr:sugar transferase [Planktotalea frisia]OJI92225.1 undecaprenyl phosphate N,N'-diacetylbacillosamine 1-phosphate transferase [Planktotalea frisia]PZX23119.1 lipopolysaccharide/colanic/teichoic acid biosynthesis glycosyltransferase [Planktotalea frisia]